jgi:sortase (surface protein transpeptidase)
MQSITNHLKWAHASRRVRISVLFIVFLLLIECALSIFLAIPKVDTAAAQSIPITSTAETAIENELASSETAVADPAPAVTPVTTPAPTPKPVAKAAAAPTPAYDSVSIPSLGFSARYIDVGLTSTNAIDVPASLVGRWNGSATPGTPGTVFLDGHNPGVFKKLPNITVGSQIIIKKASGETITYTVANKETVMLAGIDMVKALRAYNGASEGLNLMTCVGTYNANTGTTDQRLVVYAVRS